jgi:hypothetical protein
MTNKNGLSIWVIYKHPRDYPDKYIARLWRNDQATSSVMIADDIERLRDVLQFEMGLVKLMPTPQDDPVIIESWL